VITDFYAKPASERNVVRWFFLDQESRRFDDWDDMAGDLVGMLRLDVGRYPSDPRLQSLVQELKDKSRAFGEFWDGHHVAIDLPARKVIHHPTAGTLEFELEGVSPPADRDQTLDIFMAKAGSATGASVSRLMSGWKAGPRAGRV
jgi:hypothetical protein